MKKNVGLQADYLHARANEMHSELFILELEKRPVLYGIQGKYQSTRDNPNESAFTQAKACTQKQAFNFTVP